MTEPKTLAVIGGGISGMVAARELRRFWPDARVVLFESGSRLGGVLRTERIGDYLVETCADMFAIEPSAALDLCQELGQGDELLSTRPTNQRAFIATATGIVPVPKGFSMLLPDDVAAVVESELLDDENKLRFLAERNVPPRIDSGDESLQSFAVRRFGKQVFERLIQPLISGIYSADPERLSMSATLARFVMLEQKYGSLIAAAEALRNDREQKPQTDALAFADHSASGARYDLFRAPRLGIGQLIDWIVADLGSIVVRTQSSVKQVTRVNKGWRLLWSQSDSITGKSTTWRGMRVDGVVIASSARSAAEMLRESDYELNKALMTGAMNELKSELKALETASCAVVALGFERRQFRKLFEGYGIVVPACLKRDLLAASFSSNKFAGRAPADRVLIRCFIGGALQADRMELTDAELCQRSRTELDAWFQIDGSPELTRVIRWPATMPQYHVGHLEWVQRIQSAVERLPGLELAGNSYNGVGIPVCIEQGRLAAERLNQFLRRS